MTASEIKIYFRFVAMDMDVSMELYNWGKKRWVQLGSERQTTLSEAGPYLAAGRVRIKVSGRPARDTTSERLSIGFWEIKDLDVEIRGFLPNRKSARMGSRRLVAEGFSRRVYPATFSVL